MPNVHTVPNVPVSEDILMSEGCKRGDWNFVLGDGKRFIGCQDYLGIGFAGNAAEFWATAADGHAQVFRNPIGSSGICRFVYFGGTFEIAYDVVGVFDLNVMSQAQKSHWTKVQAARAPDHPCEIYGRRNESWIETIRPDQFDRFRSDIQDPALYQCLTECVPPINPASKPWGYGYEQPSRRFEPLIVPLTGETGFSFITDWLAGRALLPKAAAFELIQRLSPPRQQNSQPKTKE
jgi:hypothetical protein